MRTRRLRRKGRKTRQRGGLWNPFSKNARSDIIQALKALEDNPTSDQKNIVLDMISKEDMCKKREIGWLSKTTLNYAFQTLDVDIAKAALAKSTSCSENVMSELFKHIRTKLSKLTRQEAKIEYIKRVYTFTKSFNVPDEEFLRNINADHVLFLALPNLIMDNIPYIVEQWINCIRNYGNCDPWESLFSRPDDTIPKVILELYRQKQGPNIDSPTDGLILNIIKRLLTKLDPNAIIMLQNDVRKTRKNGGINEVGGIVDFIAVSNNELEKQGLRRVS